MGFCCISAGQTGWQLSMENKKRIKRLKGKKKSGIENCRENVKWHEKPILLIV